jgi:hypothetical protein
VEESLKDFSTEPALSEVEGLGMTKEKFQNKIRWIS